MGLLLNRQTSLLGHIENMSDNKIHNIWFTIQTVVCILAFLCVVVVWDTIPSLPAVHGVEVKTYVNGNHVDIVYKYEALRSGDFHVEYEVRNSKNSRVLSSVDTLLIVPQTTTSHSKIFSVEPGAWCTTATIVWNNGFSLRQHGQELPKSCFDVQAPVQ